MGRGKEKSASQGKDFEKVTEIVAELRKGDLLFRQIRRS